MISAFIIYIHPQLQTDPNEESAALLRVLLYKTDSAAFEGDVPEVPTKTGPPPTIVTALVLLYLGLAATMASVLFAILAKQLLNIYALASILRPNAENARSKRRMLKWFTVSLHGVVLLLSLLLQVALLLLSCAGTVFLWKINLVVASVILTLTLCILPIWLIIAIVGFVNIGFSHFRGHEVRG